jgi:hypothetical protein
MLTKRIKTQKQKKGITAPGTAQVTLLGVGCVYDGLCVGEVVDGGDAAVSNAQLLMDDLAAAAAAAAAATAVCTLALYSGQTVTSSCALDNAQRNTRDQQ